MRNKLIDWFLYDNDLRQERVKLLTHFYFCQTFHFCTPSKRQKTKGL